MADREMEIKFHLQNKGLLEEKLGALGGKVRHPRVNEWNLRFDTPEKLISARGQALRLRKDERVRLTFKGTPDQLGEITDRVELEVEVSDFSTTRRILEALGYRVMVIYEKFRTTWEYRGAEIVVDELPMGDFCEIEAESEELIRGIAGELKLTWDFRINTSYLGIFDQLKKALNLEEINLTFEDMQGMHISSSDLAIVHIYPGDA